MIKLLDILREIKINNPVLNFPLSIEKEDWDRVSKQLDKLGYKWDDRVSLLNWSPFKYYDGTIYLGFKDNKTYKKRKLINYSYQNNFDSEGVEIKN